MTTDLFAIQREHGGTVYDAGRRWIGPGPGHRRCNSSLSVWLNDDGRPLVHSFANDDLRSCLAHLGIEADQKAATMPPLEAMRLRKARADQQRAEEARRRDFCASVWRDSLPAAGSIVQAYLEGRALRGDVPAVLRFHPRAPLAYPTPDRDTPVAPAMVALVQSHDGAGAGLHVTALNADGAGKRPGGNPRRMFGKCGGGAVRLSEFAGGDLAVAEGVETARAFEELNGVPTWATLSTSGLMRFRPPAGVRRLIVAADNDDGGAGLKAARQLGEASRALCETIILAAPEGQDWNDVLREVANG